MSKITSPQDLTNRLQSILRQASTGTPMRARLAEELKQVAEDLEGQQKQAADASDKWLSKAEETEENLKSLLLEIANLEHDGFVDKDDANKVGDLVIKAQKAMSDAVKAYRQA